MFKDKIERIIQGLDDVIEISKKDATILIYGDSKSRIFNNGQDKLNSSIGTYKSSYKSFRKKKGLQTQYVDLKVTGELQKSITYDADSIFFKNDYGKKISGYNEKHFKKRIFAPSESEADIFINELDKNLSKLWKS